jgi:hypothetical protein
MKNYSIVRVGSDYVVQADEKSILKIASRRRAARLVTDASELLDSLAATQQAAAQSSIARDPGVMPDPHGVITDPPEVP